MHSKFAQTLCTQCVVGCSVIVSAAMFTQFYAGAQTSGWWCHHCMQKEPTSKPLSLRPSLAYYHRFCNDSCTCYSEEIYLGKNPSLLTSLQNSASLIAKLHQKVSQRTTTITTMNNRITHFVICREVTSQFCGYDSALHEKHSTVVHAFSNGVLFSTKKKPMTCLILM